MVCGLVLKAKFNFFVPCTTNDKLSTMKVAGINFQIQWHQRFDLEISMAKHLPKKKEEKLELLCKAVMWYTTGLTKPGDVVMGENSKLERCDPQTEDVIGGDSEDEANF
ncbi:hypothetical protein PAXRUDRAFT_170399 [Paxillus rubicundulus Ve08.2h10]|uniref:Uncharacterized protein n=1 Tax=Paxillus rubicundulus Ve08.2h10 TaxID=930991 RepID=A0A0D0CYH4_9AGAM|nr:hypothetical protein PAXRUDRAFT_170399 [Paxillus rubicundulus Ve08.2h10]